MKMTKRTMMVGALAGTLGCFLLSGLVGVLHSRAQTPQDAPLTDPVEIKKAGETLMNERCSTCHQVPDIKSHPLSEWPSIINRMAPQAFLRESEVKLLNQYVAQELQPPVENQPEQAPVETPAPNTP
jgi:hypothetical protein